MAREPIVQGGNAGDDDRQRDARCGRVLRSHWPKRSCSWLEIVLKACKKLKEPLSHSLRWPWIGKDNLRHRPAQRTRHHHQYQWPR